MDKVKYSCLFLLLILSSHLYADTKKYGPTQTKDTLWNIALSYKTNQTSMYQIMLAFYNKNPKAFYEGNMNRLKQGVYLNIPSEDFILNTNIDAAIAIVDKKIEEYEIFYRKFSAKPIINTPIDKAEIKLTNKESTVKKDSDMSQVDRPSVASPVNNMIPANKINEVKQSLKQEVQTKHIDKVDPSSLFNFGEPLQYRSSYDISVSYDDNLRLAQNETDIRSEVVTNLLFKFGTSIKVSRLSRFNIGVDIEYEDYSVFDTLNNLSYSINGRYSFATNTSFFAPLYIIKLSIGGIETDSVMRKSNLHKIGFNINKRISSAVHMTGGIQFKQRESQSLVFDTNQQSIFLNTDYSLDRKSIIYGTYHFITGDTVSSATPTLEIINASDEIEPDDAFGGVGLNQFAYKLDTKTHVFTLGFNKRLKRKLSYDVSVRYVSSESTKISDIYYDRTIVRIGILGRF